jgi:hypothetical protein
MEDGIEIERKKKGRIQRRPQFEIVERKGESGRSRYVRCGYKRKY